MPWQALTAAAAGVAYTAADMNKVVDDLTWLNAQRPIPLGGHDSGTTSWAIAAGATTFEDDSDAANFKVAITTEVASTIVVLGIARWSSSVARDTAMKMRIKITDGVTPAYGADNGEQGTSNVDNMELYTLMGLFSSVAADTWTVTMQAARNNAGDTVTIVDRQLVVFAFAE